MSADFIALACSEGCEQRRQVSLKYVNCHVMGKAMVLDRKWRCFRIKCMSPPKPQIEILDNNKSKDFLASNGSELTFPYVSRLNFMLLLQG